MPAIRIRRAVRLSTAAALTVLGVTAVTVAGGPRADAEPLRTVTAGSAGASTVTGKIAILDDAHQAVLSTGSGDIAIPDSLEHQAESLAGTGPVHAVLDAAGTPVALTPAAPASLPRGAAALAQPDQVVTIGTHHVKILPVYWGELEHPATTGEDMRAAVATVDTYFSAASGGRIRFVTDEVKPMTKISLTDEADGACPSWSVLTYATNLFKINDMMAANGTHYVLWFPNRPDCDFSGLASRPGNVVWMNGNTVPTVLAHELGHNMDLGHSGLMYCLDGEQRQVTWSAECYDSEYGDPFDVMGNSWGGFGFLSGDSRERLGLLNGTSRVLVRDTASFTLTSVRNGTGKRLAIVPAGRYVYSLDFHTQADNDAWRRETHPEEEPGDPAWWPGHGVVVRMSEPHLPSLITRSDQAVVAAHPDTYGWTVGTTAFRPGESWTSPDGKIRIAVTAATDTTADVTVTRLATDTKPPAAFTVNGADSDGWWSDGQQEISLTDPVRDAESGIASLTVNVDGKPVRTKTIAGGVVRESFWTLAAFQVPEGTHTLTVVAKDLFGNARTGATWTRKVDTKAPVVTAKPVATLRTGAIELNNLPATIRFRVSDGPGSGVEHVVLERRPTAFDAGWLDGNPTSFRGLVAAGKVNYFGISSEDNERHKRGRVNGAGTSAALSCAPKATRVTGTWTARKVPYSCGGTEAVAAKRGTKATYTVNARSVGWIATKYKDRGQAKVYVDGVYVRTVSLYQNSSSPWTKEQVFAYSWPTAGKHTITIEVLGTTGHPVVGVDGISTLS